MGHYNVSSSLVYSKTSEMKITCWCACVIIDLKYIYIYIFVYHTWVSELLGLHNIGVQGHLNNISVLSYWWSRQKKHRDSHPPAKLLPGDTENATYLRQVTSKIIIRIFKDRHLPTTIHWQNYYRNTQWKPPTCHKPLPKIITGRHRGSHLPIINHWQKLLPRFTEKATYLPNVPDKLLLHILLLIIIFSTVPNLISFYWVILPRIRQLQQTQLLMSSHRGCDLMVIDVYLHMQYVLPPLKVWVRFTPMERRARYNLMWYWLV
jgi:hypothetical protein